MDKIDLTPTGTITDLMVEMCRDGSMSTAITTLGDRLDRMTLHAKALEIAMLESDPTWRVFIEDARRDYGITDADMEVS